MGEMPGDDVESQPDFRRCTMGDLIKSRTWPDQNNPFVFPSSIELTSKPWRKPRVFSSASSLRLDGVTADSLSVCGAEHSTLPFEIAFTVDVRKGEKLNKTQASCHESPLTSINESMLTLTNESTLTLVNTYSN